MGAEAVYMLVLHVYVSVNYYWRSLIEVDHAAWK